MKRFFQKLLFILVFIALYLLTVFYIPESFYSQWLVSFVIFLTLIIFIASKIIPSAKSDRVLKQYKNAYYSHNKAWDDVKKEASLLALECPSCKTSSPYLSFLEHDHCVECKSRLWTTVLDQNPETYIKLFEDSCSYKQFHATIPRKIRRRLMLEIEKEFIQ